MILRRLWMVSVWVGVLLLLGACDLQPKPVTNPNASGAKYSADETLAKARDLIKANRLYEAQKELSALLENEPENAQALMFRGIAYIREGKVYPAIKDLAASSQIAPSAEIYFNLGNALQQAGHYDRAVVAYRASLELGPDDPEVLNNYAGSLLYLDRLPEAQQILQRVIQLRPDDPEAYTNLGISYERAKDWGQSESYFYRALEVDPNYYPAQFNLAKMYDVKGDNELAKEHYRRYLKMRPDAPDKYKIRQRAEIYDDES